MKTVNELAAYLSRQAAGEARDVPRPSFYRTLLDKPPRRRFRKLFRHPQDPRRALLPAEKDQAERAAGRTGPLRPTSRVS